MTDLVDATFLFTDIEGSTGHWERDWEAMGRAVEAHDALMGAAVDLHDGIVVKSTGDGVFAWFRSVRSAVRAAVAAQQDLEAHPWPTDSPVRVRMGVHTGAAEQRDDDWFGREVSLAARVADAGHGGDVLLSEAAAAVLGDDVIDLGEHRLSGIARPQRLHAARRGEESGRPLRALAVERTNLPAELDEFVGREEERVALVRLVSAHRVVTVTGPGGAGKTRLAIRAAGELADRAADGVWFADLVPARSEAEVLHAVAEATGLVASPGRDLRPQLVDHLRNQRCLLVLDNCEQVVDDVADALLWLLSGAPQVRVLATSRVILDITGETVYRIGHLALPPEGGTPEEVLGSDAGALFLARAAQARPELDVGPADAELVETVCRQVDRLPLGIELAAAQLRALELRDLPGHIASAGGRLRGGRRRRRTRHASIDDVVEASYDLLTEEERQVFVGLGVFAGSFSATTVAEVAGLPPSGVTEVLGALVDHSMIDRADSGHGARFRMLETLRSFAWGRLVSGGSAEAAQDRHLEWALGVVGQLEAAMRTPGQDAALAQARPDHDSLRAARAWAQQRGDDLAALRITASAPIDAESERDKLIGALLARVDDVPDELRGRSLYTCAAAALERGAYAEMLGFAEEAGGLFARMGSRTEATYARFLRTIAAWGVGDQPDVGTEMAAVLAGFEALGDPMGQAYAAWILAQWLLDEVPEDPRIVGLGHRAAELFGGVGATFGLAHAREGLAYIHLRDDDRESAAGAALSALAAFRRGGQVGCAAHALDAVGVILVEAGRVAAAAELLGAASALRGSAGAQMRPWERGHHLACMQAIEDRLAPAVRDAALVAGAELSLDAAVARAEAWCGDASAPPT